MAPLSIGQLAKAAGVHVETVRYYERRGLLDEPPRTPSGYRQYAPADLWRLRFIGRAKRLGFSLAEIGDLLGSGDGRSPEVVLGVARAKLGVVAARQRDLARLRCRLEHLVDVCSSGDPSDCVELDVGSDLVT